MSKDKLSGKTSLGEQNFGRHSGENKKFLILRRRGRSLQRSCEVMQTEN